MEVNPERNISYFTRLKQVSFVGYIYKKYVSSPVLYRCASRFGPRIVEVGCGIGSGVLGAYSKSVVGLEINPLAVDFCKSKGFAAKLIDETGCYPAADGEFDACLLDNVLEHIQDPSKTLDECHRITRSQGGLIIVVPGVQGYQSDDDHKIFYGADELRTLDARWKMQSLFSIPFLIRSKWLSNTVRQYCLVACYQKNE